MLSQRAKATTSTTQVNLTPVSIINSTMLTELRHISKTRPRTLTTRMRKVIMALMVQVRFHSNQSTSRHWWMGRRRWRSKSPPSIYPSTIMCKMWLSRQASIATGIKTLMAHITQMWHQGHTPAIKVGMLEIHRPMDSSVIWTAVKSTQQQITILERISSWPTPNRREQARKTTWMSSKKPQQRINRHNSSNTSSSSNIFSNNSNLNTKQAMPSTHRDMATLEPSNRL